MVSFICLFFPSFISVAVLNSLEKREQSIQSFLITYGSFATVINFIIFVILVTIFKDGQNILYTSYFILTFSVKYLAFAVALAALLPFLFEYLKQNISIKISVKSVSLKRDDIK